MAISQDATTVLADARSKFELRYDEPVSPEQSLVDETPIARKRSVLAPSEAKGFTLSNHRIVPLISREKLEATLPEAADGATELALSAAKVRISLLGAGNIQAAVADGYLVYPNAVGPGGHLFVRVTKEVVEDFLIVPQAPKQPSLRYRVDFPSGVSLRLVDDVFEVLDGQGRPLLRAPRPFLVDASGKGTPLSVAVEGCAVDTHPRAPWGRKTTSPGASSCTLKLTWSNQGVTYPALVDPAWSSTGSMVEPRANHSLTLLDSGLVLAAGGVNAGPVQPGAELFDPSTGTWAATGAPLTRRVGHAATKLLDGRVIIAGGSQGTTRLRSAEIYDPSTGAWSSTGSLSVPRRNYHLHRLGNGKVLAAGGYAPRGVHASAELYDASAGSWSTTGSMSTARGFYASSLLDEQNVLVSGGYNGSYLASTERYSQAAGTWTSAGSLASARADHAQVTLGYGGRVLVAGGKAGSALATTEIYKNDAWVSGPNLTQARSSLTANRLFDSSVVLAGGFDSTSTAQTDLYFPTPSTLSSTSSLTAARSGHASTSLLAPSTKVLVSGGSDGSSYLATSELFDPTAGVVIGAPDSEGSGFGPLKFKLVWTNPDLTGTFGMSGNITAQLKNNSNKSQSAYVDLIALGPSRAMSATRSQYFNVTLEAGASQTLTVPLAAFPIYPVGAESQILLQLRPHESGVATGEKWSINTRLTYEVNSTYTQVTFHGQLGRDANRVQPPSSATWSDWLNATSTVRAQLVVPPTGKIWSETYADMLPFDQTFYPDQQATFEGIFATNFHNLWVTSPPSYTPPSDSKYYKFCGRWLVDYSDVGKGEDILAAPGIQATPARYARYLVLSTGGTTPAGGKGHLDNVGCTPPLLLGTNESFTFYFSPELFQSTNSTSVSVWLCEGALCQPNGATARVFASGVKAAGGGSSSGTALSVNFDSGQTSNSTRAAGVASEFLHKPDNGTLGNQYFIMRVNQGAFFDRNNKLGEAGGAGTRLSLGDSFEFDADGLATASGPHTSFSKFTVAHELGHCVQSNSSGFANPAGFSKADYPCTSTAPKRCQQEFTWDGGSLPPPTESVCRCDFIGQGNRFHCLQSKEIQGAAQLEGFAHFFAADLFNDGSQDNCTFVYYKDSLDKQGVTVNFFESTPPPRAVSCFYPMNGDPQRWLDSYCPGSRAKKGVEGDWLTFFYELHTKTADAYSFEDLHNLYKQACTGSTSTSCAQTSVFFDEPASGQAPPLAQKTLRQAADDLFSSDKADYLRDTGFKHRVNNL